MMRLLKTELEHFSARNMVRQLGFSRLAMMRENTFQLNYVEELMLKIQEILVILRLLANLQLQQVLEELRL